MRPGAEGQGDLPPARIDDLLLAFVIGILLGMAIVLFLLGMGEVRRTRPTAAAASGAVHVEFVAIDQVGWVGDVLTGRT